MYHKFNEGDAVHFDLSGMEYHGSIAAEAPRFSDGKFYVHVPGTGFFWVAPEHLNHDNEGDTMKTKPATRTITIRQKSPDGTCMQAVDIPQPDIISVVAQPLPKGGYRYTAIMANGDTRVIREKATKLYPRAYLYGGIVATGKQGLASAFSFGKAPVATYGNPDRGLT